MLSCIARFPTTNSLVLNLSYFLYLVFPRSNAGIASHGSFVEHSMADLLSIIRLNVEAVSILTRLFGKDMKERRRGRILIVSSLCALANGISTVALYAATKAFEKTLAVAISKEMEPYGVGVTCLTPGAIKETNFRSDSKSGAALCWFIPG